jgi:hypothetical protein
MPPAAIVEFMARARARRNLRSGLESTVLGIAAAFVALAACHFSPAQIGRESASAWTLAACAALSGVAMAATWWVERAKKTDLELAWQVDTRLHCDGALATVYEASVRGDGGALLALLEQRVISAQDRSSLARALPGVGFIWLAPPAIGAALLALALELPVQPGRGSIGADQRAGVQGTGDPGPSDAANDLLRRVRDQSAAAQNDPRLRAQLLREIDTAVAGLRAGNSEGTPATERSRAELLAQRARLSEDPSRPPADPNSPPKGALPDPTGPDSRLGAGSTAEGSKSLLTQGGPERTMSGSNRPIAAGNGARSATRSPESGSPGEAGTLAGRWWDERYDPVVQGWRRALAARRGQH